MIPNTLKSDELPSPADLGIVDKVDVTAFETALQFVTDKLKASVHAQKNIVCVSTDDVKLQTKSAVSTEFMEALATVLSNKGWRVYKRWLGGRIDSLTIIFP